MTKFAKDKTIKLNQIEIEARIGDIQYYSNVSHDFINTLRFAS